MASRKSARKSARKRKTPKPRTTYPVGAGLVAYAGRIRREGFRSEAREILGDVRKGRRTLLP